MDEFLRQNYSLLTYSVEFLAAVTGIFCYKKYKNTAAKYFIYYLIYIFLVDFLGRYPTYLKDLELDYIIKNTVFEKNYLWYAVLSLLGRMFFSLMYFKLILKNKLFIKLFSYVAYFLITISIISIVFGIDQFYYKSSSFISINSSISIILGIILYLVELLQNDKILDFYKSINFYISSVFLIWLLITTPLTFYQIYFSTADWNFVFLRWQIYLFANIFMYITFAFALIYCKPEND